MSWSSVEDMEWWREYLGGTSVHLFEVIHRAIDLAISDYPDQFILQRDRIAQRLFSSTCSSNSADHGGGRKDSSEEEEDPHEVLINNTVVATESEGVFASNSKATSEKIPTAESKVGEGKTRPKISIKCRVLTEESIKTMDDGGGRIQGIRTPQLPSESSFGRRIEFKAEEGLKRETVPDRIRSIDEGAKIANLQGKKEKLVKLNEAAARKSFNGDQGMRRTTPAEAHRRPGNVAAAAATARLEKRVESESAERRPNNGAELQKIRLDDTEFERMLDGKTKPLSNVDDVKERLEGAKRKLREAYDRADSTKRVKRTQVLDYSEAVKLQKKSSCSEELIKKRVHHLGKMMHVSQQRV